MLKTLIFIFFFETAVKVAIGECLRDDVSAASVQTVGGHDVDIKQSPYHVSLARMGIYHFCGGSILSADYVLTAAHCAKYIQKNDDPKFFKIRAGSSYFNKSGDVYDILSIVWNPQFSVRTPSFDAGIIKTAKMTLNGVTTKAVKLPDVGAALKPGATVVVTGFGFTKEEDGYPPASVLQAVSVPIVSLERCRELWSTHNYSITDRVTCAQSSGTGEPGGPLVEESTLIQYGILMFIGGDYTDHGFEEFPDVYTSVPTVRGWIREQTGL